MIAHPLPHSLNKMLQPISLQNRFYLHTKRTAYHVIRMGHILYDSLGRRTIPSSLPTWQLTHQSGLLQLYGNIITDQEEIERAPSQSTRGVHYIPHHPVRNNSPTTPIRIVYNCSCCKSPRHASLNDCLMVGDSALTDLCAVLWRFRLHCYALLTDIEKVFLHVKLDS